MGQARVHRWQGYVISLQVINSLHQVPIFPSRGCRCKAHPLLFAPPHTHFLPTLQSTSPEGKPLPAPRTTFKSAGARRLKPPTHTSCPHLQSTSPEGDPLPATSTGIEAADARRPAPFGPAAAAARGFEVRGEPCGGSRSERCHKELVLMWGGVAAAAHRNPRVYPYVRTRSSLTPASPHILPCYQCPVHLLLLRFGCWMNGRQTDAAAGLS